MTLRPTARQQEKKRAKLMAALRPAPRKYEESTLLYVLSHTTPHTNLHINKSTEA